MSHAHGLNNQGIAHLGFRAGSEPFCKSRRALICVAIADRDRWPRICVRCAAKADKMAALSAKIAARKAMESTNG